MENHYDIAIIGGGMAGASLACALAGQPLRVAVIERIRPETTAQPGYDDRGLALSLSSSRILAAIGVWQELAASAIPIRHIHISDRGRFGSVHLHAEEAGLPALAHVVPARELGKVLTGRTMSLPNVEYICPATVSAVHTGTETVAIDYQTDGQTRRLHCRLLVAADGTDSAVRDMLGIGVSIKDYRQTAIVSTVSTELPHRFTAFERFTRQGPIAMLPVADRRCVAVHIVAAERSDEYLAMDDQQYLAALQKEFGRRLGSLSRQGMRKSYPIRLLEAERQYAERTVLIGNAAHTIHPNGAQGFNLGLRDTAALAESIITTSRNGGDPGSSAMLEAYCQSRVQDQTRVVRCTDLLAGLFYTEDPLRACARNLGMLMLDLSPALKRGFIRHATGLAGRQAAMVSGTENGLR